MEPYARLLLCTIFLVAALVGEGLAERVSEGMLGLSSQNVSATDVIWTFFAAHGRRP